MNLAYLGHDEFTDIITFQYNHSPIVGELYISIERVRENAQLFEQTFDRELRRVMAHGVLHMAGYSDKNKESKIEMRAKEDYYLNIWENNSFN